MDSVKNICKKGYTFGASDSSECFIESLQLENTDQTRLTSSGAIVTIDR